MYVRLVFVQDINKYFVFTAAAFPLSVLMCIPNNMTRQDCACCLATLGSFTSHWKDLRTFLTILASVLNFCSLICSPLIADVLLSLFFLHCSVTECLPEFKNQCYPQGEMYIYAYTIFFPTVGIPSVTVLIRCSCWFTKFYMFAVCCHWICTTSRNSTSGAFNVFFTHFTLVFSRLLSCCKNPSHTGE